MIVSIQISVIKLGNLIIVYYTYNREMVYVWERERESANVYIRMREKEDVVNEKKGDGEIEIDDVCKRRRMFWETLYPIQWK